MRDPTLVVSNVHLVALTIGGRMRDAHGAIRAASRAATSGGAPQGHPAAACANLIGEDSPAFD